MQSELPPSTESTPSEPSAPVEAKGVWARFSRAQKIVASIGLVILMLPILGAAGFVAVKGVKDWQALGDVITRLSIFTLVIIGIFYAVAKAKSRSAAWASVITLLTLSTCFSGLMVAGFVGAARKIARVEADKKAQTAILQMADRAEQSTNSDQIDPAATRKNADLTASALTEVLSAESPKDKAAIAAAMEHVKAMAEANATYEESLKPFADAGGIDPKTLTDPGAARQRRTMLDGPRSRFQFVRAAWINLAPSVEATMRTAGATPALIRGFVNGVRNSPTSALQAENLDIEERLLQNMEVYLSILEKHDGNWTVNDDGKIMFGADVPDQDVDKLNANVDDRNVLVKRQSEIHASVVENMRNAARKLTR